MLERIADAYTEPVHPSIAAAHPDETDRRAARAEFVRELALAADVPRPRAGASARR